MKKIIEVIKSMWEADKGVTIFLLMAVMGGLNFRVTMMEFWLALLILVGVFGFFARKGDRFNTIKDYQEWIVTFKTSALNVKKKDAIEYEAPPRPDLSFNHQEAIAVQNQENTNGKK